jgi:hypothetical protein
VKIAEKCRPPAAFPKIVVQNTWQTPTRCRSLLASEQARLPGRAAPVRSRVALPIRADNECRDPGCRSSPTAGYAAWRGNTA